jgi:homoserine dehydrogenase
MSYVHAGVSQKSNEADVFRSVRSQGTAERKLSLGLIGPGRVGRVLLEQISAAKSRLAQDMGIALVFRGAAASTLMYLEEDGDFSDFSRSGPWATDLDAFVSHVSGDGQGHVLLVDCTASSSVADHYAGWLERGLHIVTPNKQAGSGPLARWTGIRSAQGAGARFRHETTVCAGLPVLSVLRDLLDTGDELLSIEGMFSGTLAWLCNRFDGSAPFSKLIHEARSLGYTEPDPRDDLSGIDVARKLVILAREAGWKLSLEDVQVQNLVTPEFSTMPLPQFMESLDRLDASMSLLLEGARSSGKVIRYVASLDSSGRAHVALRELPPDHAFAHTRLTDNVVQFTTRRYRSNPLQVQGPGAGQEVTAGGIFADILRIAESLSEFASVTDRASV